MRGRAKILIAPYLAPPGGGSALGAWTVQALRDDFDLTVLTWDGVRLDQINSAFGTSLVPQDARWITVAPLLRYALSALPNPGALLQLSINMRYLRRLLKRSDFDLVIGTMNELDVGRPAVQYVHYPWASMPRPEVDYRWYHVASVLRLYRRFCTLVSGYQMDRARQNLTLANSRWTASRFESWYGRPCRVLYPPVVGGFPALPHDQRECAFITVGRISPEKELEKIIDILARVRRRGHEVALSIVGHEDNPTYAARVYAAASPHRDWITFHHDLERDDLAQLIVQHRYGIHGMKGEHFGIAPAELQLAGCITFVPDEGGPTEIVQGDERVIYHDVEEAVAKIATMLDDEELEHQMLAAVTKRAQLFGTDRFSSEMHEAVAGFLQEMRA